MSQYETKSLRASLFKPTSSLSGNEAPSIYRGANMILRGGASENPYFECFAGNLDLSENYDLDVANFKLTDSGGTATVAFTAGLTTVTGTNTVFKTDLHIGQKMIAGTQCLAVREVVSDTSFICYRAPDTSESGLTARLLPQMSEMDGKRIVMRTGNAVTTGKGHILAVGSGILYRNGSALSSSLTATNRAQAAIYRPATNDFVIKSLGYAGVPPQMVIDMITGGTKAMTDLNKYSFLLSYWSGAPEGTDGYSNTTEPLKLDSTAAAIQVNGVNNKFRADLTTSLVGMPSNAKGFIIWGNLGGKQLKSIQGATVTTTSPNQGNYENGPWFRVAKVKVASVTCATGDISAAADTITLTAHPFETGDQIFTSATTTRISATALGSPIGLTTPIFAIKIDANTIKIAATKALALAGTADDITSAGSGTHTFGYLQSGDLYEFEYLDEDIYNEATGGNDRPPGAEFIFRIEGRVGLISCFGKRTTTDGEGSNPGPSIVVSKFANPDGFPTEWTATVEGTIVGWFQGVGRWFIMTSSSLEFIFSTSLFGQQSQGGNDIELPIANRPYWKTGAANRYSIILVDDTLYGRSGNKFFQSVGNGDENVKKYDFGSVVEDITRTWNDGHVLTGNHPQDTQVCFFHSASQKNASGYWESEILPYSLFYNAWLPKIVLSSTTRDMIVSGVATVNEKLEFLCGGRVQGGTYQTKTYRFAAGEAGLTSMPYYLVWQISDDGQENAMKQIHFVKPQGKFTSANIQIHGSRRGEAISPTNMENGAQTEAGTYFSGNIAVANSSLVTDYLPIKTRIKNLGNYAVRIGGTWGGSGIKDRLDELVVAVSSNGRQR
jgi:hypothetical protein